MPSPPTKCCEFIKNPPLKLFENQKQRVGVPTRCLTISTGGKSGFACNITEKKGILILRCGVFRCVGAVATCAGARGVPSLMSQNLIQMDSLTVKSNLP